MPERTRAPYEYAIIAIVVILTVALSVALYAKRERVRRGQLLVQELSTLRAGVQLYRILNDRIPPSLQQLAEESYPFEGAPRPYLQRLPRDADGRFVDPFGNPYRYDPQRGWVQSVTEGFTDW